MTHDELAAVVRGLAPVVRDLILAEGERYTAALTLVGTRVAALETDRPTLALADLPALRDRVTRLEAGASAAERGLDVLGLLRERVAAVETRPAVPGPAGPPGPGLEHWDLSYDGERTATLTIQSATGESKSIAMRFPIPIYVGVYRPGATYTRGDVVTWEGSTWLCGEDTSSKPLEGGKTWRLVVKRGRDGRDGKDAPGAGS
jgi:hypothetical protein